MPLKFPCTIPCSQLRVCSRHDDVIPFSEIIHHVNDWYQRGLGSPKWRICDVRVLLKQLPEELKKEQWWDRPLPNLADSFTTTSSTSASLEHDASATLHGPLAPASSGAQSRISPSIHARRGISSRREPFSLPSPDLLSACVHTRSTTLSVTTAPAPPPPAPREERRKEDVKEKDYASVAMANLKPPPLPLPPPLRFDPVSCIHRRRAQAPLTSLIPYQFTSLILKHNPH
ncbi:hypothetical protein BJ165DRAFT_1535162 [Panaeolus papilionaceus]|nr:hypothetical protein BJ165DRAFT_1535162 [Panaeolus papilionaceus]